MLKFYKAMAVSSLLYVSEAQVKKNKDASKTGGDEITFLSVTLKILISHYVTTVS
jgi:hypothetical protein